MPRRKAPEDMSVEELRRLLIEKRRGARRERLEHFKKTGRVVDVAPDMFSESASVVDTLEETTDQVPVSRRRRVMDRLLLVVEVLAVVGLVGVLISGFGILRDLNAEVASALIQETLTPTPLVMAVVLPQDTRRLMRREIHDRTSMRSRPICSQWCSRWQIFRFPQRHQTRRSVSRSPRSVLMRQWYRVMDGSSSKRVWGRMLARRIPGKQEISSFRRTMMCMANCSVIWISSRPAIRLFYIHNNGNMCMW